MPYQQFEKYLDSEVGSYNKELLNLARNMLANSPPLPPIITQKEESDVTVAKEQLASNYYRSVKDSLKNRWDLVEKGQVALLEDIIRINDQLLDAHKKDEQTFIDCLVDRAQRMKLTVKIDMMNNFLHELEKYIQELEKEEQRKRPVKMFMQMCADNMGFQRPELIVDRHETLNYIKGELLRDHERRSSALRAESEKLHQMRIQMSQENMLSTIRMSKLKDALEEKQSMVAQLEYQLHELLHSASDSSVSLFRGVSAVHNIYEFLMKNRGLEVMEIDSFAKLDAIQDRIIILEEIMKEAYVTKKTNKRKSKKMFVRRKKKKRANIETKAKEEKLSTETNQNHQLCSNNNHVKGRNENACNQLSSIKENRHESFFATEKRAFSKETSTKSTNKKTETVLKNCVESKPVETHDNMIGCLTNKCETTVSELTTTKSSCEKFKRTNSMLKNMKQIHQPNITERLSNTHRANTSSALMLTGLDNNDTHNPTERRTKTITETVSRQVDSFRNRHIKPITMTSTFLTHERHGEVEDKNRSNQMEKPQQSRRRNHIEGQLTNQTTKTNTTLARRRLDNSRIGMQNDQILNTNYSRKPLEQIPRQSQVGSISAAVGRIVSMPIGRQATSLNPKPPAYQCPAWASRIIKRDIR